MILLSILQKMRQSISYKVENGKPGLYVSLLFPIMFAFLLAFAGSRLVGYLITYGYMPQIYWEPSPGLHVHHYTYGFFLLAAAGYLGLIFNGPRAKFLIALLLGFGLGLAIDEFGMWLHLRDDDVVRWSYDGFSITIGLFVFLLTFRRGARLFRVLWPFRRAKPASPPRDLDHLV